MILILFLCGLSTEDRVFKSEKNLTNEHTHFQVWFFQSLNFNNNSQSELIAPQVCQSRCFCKRPLHWKISFIKRQSFGKHCKTCLRLKASLSFLLRRKSFVIKQRQNPFLRHQDFYDSFSFGCCKVFKVTLGLDVSRWGISFRYFVYIFDF